jgi:tyrosine-protein phosphatase SIW14
MLVTPPLSFSRVQDGIFRSAYPTRKSLQYIIDNLFLRSLVCLCPKELKNDLREFASEKSIILAEFNIGLNQEPFVSMFEESVQNAVDFISDESNHPTLVFCITGQKKTGCVIGCFRKMSGWSLTSILHEYEQVNDPDGSLSDMIFIENFK